MRSFLIEYGKGSANHGHMIKHISILISGRVQGVFYRASAKEKADQLGISGTVQNYPDGKVYIEASGETDNLALFEAWCRQGPRLAYVKDVEVKEMAPGHFSGFVVFR